MDAHASIDVGAQPMVRTTLRRHALEPIGNSRYFLWGSTVCHKGIFAAIQDCTFHPSKASLLAVGTVEGRLRLFDCSVAEPAETLSVDAHNLSCTTVAFARDSLVLTGSADKSVLIYDTAKRRAVCRLEEAHASEITRLHILDENAFASGDDDGTIQTWDLRQRKATQSFSHHQDYISELAAQDARNCLLASSGDGSVSIVDLRKNKIVGRSDGNPDDSLESMALVKHGGMVVCGCMSGLLSVYKWGKWDSTGNSCKGQPGPIDALVKLDEDTIVAGCGDGSIRVVSIAPTRLVGILGVSPDGDCNALAASPDDTLLASTSYGNELRLWNLEGEEEDGAEDDGPAEGNDEKAAAAADSDSEDELRAKRRQPKKKLKKDVVAASGDSKARERFFKDLSAL